jgi:hypothetical protein
VPLTAELSTCCSLDLHSPKREVACCPLALLQRSCVTSLHLLLLYSEA